MNDAFHGLNRQLQRPPRSGISHSIGVWEGRLASLPAEGEDESALVALGVDVAFVGWGLGEEHEHPVIARRVAGERVANPRTTSAVLN